MRLALSWALCLFALPVLATPQQRVFDFYYDLPEQVFPADEAVDIYIPLPTDVAGQEIVIQSLQSTIEGKFGREDEHGNSYYHLHRPAGDTTPVRANLHWTVKRWAVGAHGAELTPRERAQALAPDRLVPVDHEVLQPILSDIREMRSDASPEATARAMYDWVVDNVEYKKVGTGWGNGDTFWACSERYGNCTDFHALLISLARSEGIPARFEIGFPVPTDSGKGKIGGYHCWVHLYLPGRGWVPMDASEASKHPDKRELFFGGQPADRIRFTVGRDLVVSPATAGDPLNYFIYPHVEVGGEPWPGKVDVSFSFAETAAGDDG